MYFTVIHSESRSRKTIFKVNFFKSIMSIGLATSLCMSVFLAFCGKANAEPNSSETDFITSQVDLDILLKRPYVDNVPLGFNEEVYSLYQPGWGFDRADIYRSGLQDGWGMPVLVLANGSPIAVQEAEFTPSYVTSSGVAGQETVYINHARDAGTLRTVSFDQTSYGCYLDLAFDGQKDGNPSDYWDKNWNIWIDPIRSEDEWLQIDFTRAKTISQLKLYVYADSNIAFPAAIAVQYWDGVDWQVVSGLQILDMHQGENTLTFDQVLSEKIKIVFTPTTGKALSFYEIELLEAKPATEGINHALDADTLKSVSFDQTAYGNDLSMAFDGDYSIGKNWNTWNSPLRAGDEWIQTEFAAPVSVDRIRLYSLQQGAGGCALPSDVRVEYFDEQAQDWMSAADPSPLLITEDRTGVDSTVTAEMSFERIQSSKIKLTFTPQSNTALAFYEIELIEEKIRPVKLNLIGHKYITPNGQAVVLLSGENPSEVPVEVTVSAQCTSPVTVDGNTLTGSIAGLSLRVVGSEGFTAAENNLTQTVTVQPGARVEFRISMGITEAVNDIVQSQQVLLADPDPLVTQKTAFHQWFLDNIPYVDLPDDQIQQIYYFRWYTYRNNIRKTPDNNYVITEFMPWVGWSGTFNTINMAVGLHVNEGRWLKDTSYMEDYLNFWLFGKGKSKARAFSNWIPGAFYSNYIARKGTVSIEELNALKADFAGWISTNYNTVQKLFWSNNGADGMEYSAVAPADWGINGYRPTVNAYRYGDAQAIAALCRLLGDNTGAADFMELAEKIRTETETKLWDSIDGFYKWRVIGENGLTEPREEIGFAPWMFNLPADTVERGNAWKTLTDPAVFAAEYGPRTVEKDYARVTPEGEYGTGLCRWDGPSWPFATSQTLLGMANLLNNYENQTAVSKVDYLNLLKTYTKSQYKNGSPWIAENLDADTGKWIADESRSPNYNHSSFTDLVITGLLGVRPDETDTLTINPLTPDDWDYFCMENLPYHGRLVTVLYDKDGTRYDQGAGLLIYLDGKLVLSKVNVQKVSIPITESAPETGSSFPLWVSIAAACSAGLIVISELYRRKKVNLRK